MHPLALHISTGITPHLQCFSIIAIFEADFFHQDIGIMLDHLDCLGGKDVHGSSCRWI